MIDGVRGGSKIHQASNKHGELARRLVGAAGGSTGNEGKHLKVDGEAVERRKMSQEEQHHGFGFKPQTNSD